jgi:hypothetical protein
MNPKHIATALLTAFVIVSIAFMVVRETRRKPAAVAGGDGEIAVTVAGSEGGNDTGRKVVAYYFHSTKRCPTCLKIESYTKESIERTFAKQLESGVLEMRLVNVDEAENAHFIDDYKLTTKAVVLSLRDNGEETKWKDLNHVWEYVGEKRLFMDYIETETKEFLGELMYE